MSSVTLPPPAPMRSPGRRLLRSLPVMLRVGFADAIAYRAEFFVWVLAYTMPLVMLALWNAVARDAPVGRFGQREFQAYFLSALVVRLMTGSWVVWEMNMEVRQGTLSQRLLRPVHPFIAYASENIGAVPMRSIAVFPILVATWLWLGFGMYSSDPVQLAMILPSLVGGWGLMFLSMVIIGTMSLVWESSGAIFELWMACYMLMSGYVMPLEVLPPGMVAVIEWLPFKYMLAFPVENALGLMTREQSLHAAIVQMTWIALMLAGALALWKRNVRRYAAFGG